MKIKKIIVAGNPNYGLGKSINKAHPEAKFYSRTNGGMHLNLEDGRNAFTQETLNYDIFISCSYLPYFQQLLLVGKVWNVWKDNGKKGQIIVFGSTADTSKGARFYSIEKRALKDFCRNYGDGAAGGGPNLIKGNGIKITYIAPGVLDLPKQREKYPDDLGKINPDYLVSVMNWILEQPEDILIHDISLDPIT